ncbi:MAG TPA: protein kinase [Blastocatellia bacterium]|nr:protein kinase [Blastocatellia bacterium]
MEHKDWQRAEELFHALLELPAEQRCAYFDHACPEDAALRAEVESLLSAFESRRGFIEQPAFGLGMSVLSGASARESFLGKLIGPYKILMLLGEGGMGEVYLADDLRLGRKVALKFLSAKSVNDASAKRRLMKEAQAAANLNHANICTIHGLEEIDGYSFIVMEYIEGETLASLIQQGVLDLKQIPDLAIQAVRALAEAHSHGLIHRDIKPQNIIVTSSGQVKVLDFGLAKVIQQRNPARGAAHSESHNSQLGLVIGTLTYMSPEQLRTERLDFRSDIFSFGVVLYEMISGSNPYLRRSDAETISAILTADPPPLTSITSDITAELSLIAQRCLNKSREQRYQSASELLLSLDHCRTALAAQPQLSLYFRLRSLVVLALTFLLLMGVTLIHSRVTGVRTLAVLPMSNDSGDVSRGELSEGLMDGLINRLSQLSKLKVKAPAYVSAYKDESLDPQKAGRDLNVDAVLYGSIMRRGESLVLRISLINSADGSQVWGAEYDVSPAEMQTLQEEISGKIVSSLQLSLSEDEKGHLRAQQTLNPEASKWYYRGLYYWKWRDEKNIRIAIDCFNQAIRLAPAFAKAHAGLADCYVLLSTVAYGPPLTTKEAMTKAKAAALAALEIDDSLCEAHTSLGTVLLKYDWNWQEAEREFKQAISIKPNYAPAHLYYSYLLSLMGRWSESIVESETAKELEPFSPMSNINLARALYFARQYDRAAGSLLKYLEENPDDAKALNVIGFIYQQKGMSKSAIESFEKLYSLSKVYGAAPLGYAYAMAGRRADALRILSELDELSKQTTIPPQEKAIIYIGLGDKDETSLLLQEACRERFTSLPFLIIDPVFASLRSDPRFADLLRCANMTQQ